MPEGWSKDLDLPTAFNLVTEEAAGGFLGMWPDLAAATTEGCSRTPAPGVGRTPADIVALLAAHPGLVTTEARATTIGGFGGQAIEIEGDAAWTNPCADPRGGVDPHVFGLFSVLVATADNVGWVAMADRSRAAVSIVDTGGGHTLTIYVEADKPAFESFVAIARPVVESFDFAPE